MIKHVNQYYLISWSKILIVLIWGWADYEFMIQWTLSLHDINSLWNWLVQVGHFPIHFEALKLTSHINKLAIQNFAPINFF